MKSTWQVGLAIAMLMGIVAAAAYLTEFTSSNPSLKPDVTIDDQPPPTPALTFLQKLSKWVKDDSESFTEAEDQAKFVKQVEVLSDHYYDFWCFNENEAESRISVGFASCTCLRLEAGLIKPDAWSAWQQAMNGASLMESADGGLSAAVSTAVLMSTVKYVEIPEQKSGKVTIIPPARNGVAQPAVIRAHFRPKGIAIEGKSDRLRMIIDAKIGDRPSDRTELSVLFNALPAVGHLPNILDVGEMADGQPRTMDLHLISMTRVKLSPTIVVEGPDPDDKGDPCIEVAAPKLLSRPEMVQVCLENGFSENNPLPLCAYRVRVTVHESRNGRQLDLGLITRKLTIKADAGLDSFAVPVMAVVRGEVRVIGGDEKDSINLGNFRLDRGRSKTVSLSTTRIDLELEVVPQAESLVKVTLGEPEVINGHKQWRLSVEAPPGISAGDLPASTVVVLKTKDATARRMRIPVRGNAYR